VTLSATIDLENSSALLGMDRLRRSQLPFAQALALTRTAQEAQRAEKAEIPSRFEVRNTYLERGVRIQAATKRRPQSAVFWRAPGGASRRGFADTLARQETGGLKRPRKRMIAIPRQVKRGKSGRITKRNQPAAVLDRKRTFVAPLGHGGDLGIYERVGKRRRPIRLLYHLTPRTLRVEERWRFVETAEATARKVYPKEFGKAFAKALATRR